MVVTVSDLNINK